MKGKNKAARVAAREARRAKGKPEVSSYAAKGGPCRYELKRDGADRRGTR